MTYIKHRLGQLLALFLCLTGHSVFSAEVQQYDIELLIFQHLVNSDAGEVWRDTRAAWFGDSAADSDSRAEASVNWLGAGEYRLAPQQASLRSSSQYRPLAHLAWRQTTQDRQSALPVRLPVLQAGQGTAYVDGRVTVAVERYLHMTLDLALHTSAPVQSDTDTGPLESLAVPIKLVEQRRMRSSEIHYFDNPRFGVLALITPYKPATP